MRFFRELRILFWSKDNLSDSFAIAQINKYDAAVIARNVDPTGKGRVLADVDLAKGIAIMRPVGGHVEPETLKNFATLSSSASPAMSDSSRVARFFTFTCGHSSP